MSRKIDLTGMKFGRLTVQYQVPNNNHHTRWHCVCECGNTKDVLQQNLANGHVRSCGCLLSERSLERINAFNSSMGREHHNETKSRLYHIWIGIKARCLRKASTSYKNYGARGITICREWLDSFATFQEWALSNGYSDELSIDRVNVDEGYSPENCRWVSKSVQSFNIRMPARNTSGHVGVSWNKQTNKWVAYISKNNKLHPLGSFNSFDDAVAAREAAEADWFKLT